jgi:hypothetical protein
MANKARWLQYKTWSGVAVRGTVPVEVANFLPLDASHTRPMNHIDRAVFITSRLEAPNWGSVQGYDGAAMSGGLLHNVAVLPRDLAQGDLFRLIGRIFEHFDSRGWPVAGSDLKSALRYKGWGIGRDGLLRDAAGNRVSGQAIRDEFSPPDGKVPRSGPDFEKACRWAEMFSALLSEPSTYRPQIDYAATWLAQGQKQLEIQVYRAYSAGTPALADTGTVLDSPIGLPAATLPQAVDLAMCVYHAFSVNGPAPAASCLTAAQPTPAAEKFAASLIRKLGKKQFGRWVDEPGEGGGRYDKTRRAVIASGFWPRALVQNLMPVDL